VRRAPAFTLTAALALLGALALASGASLSPAALARALLALAGAAALGWWWLRARGAGRPPRFADTPRLTVVQRVGLTARTGLALVEVDGRAYLLVHGEGFARLRPVPCRAAVAPRLEVAR